MSTSTTGHAAPAGVGVLPTPKQQFLDAYEREHQITMRLLRAYPPDKIELRPHPRSKTARELAWMFAAERALGTAVLNDWYATNKPGSGQMPQAPADWQDLLAAIEKALAHNERHENRVRGASTLSQQTAKNLFLWDGRSWVRKGLEAGLTLGVETVWSKKRILTVYLNIAEFGDGVFGVEAASQRYFNKPASRLSMSEAALLAAVLPNPIKFKASAPSGYVRSRQAWIMRQMRQLGGEGFMERNNLM